MPKIDKKTLKILPRTNIRIYKFENRQTYFCSFYIGLGHTNKKSGKFEKTLQTKNVNEAIKKATELYKECLKFLKTRVELDLALFRDDIWAH